MTSLNYVNSKYFKLVHSSSEVHSELDISARCDICGDSKKDKTKKRLHLFSKPSWEHDTINCFNCQASMSPWNYFKEYHPSVFPQYKNELQQIKLSSLSFNTLFNSEEKSEIKEDLEFNVTFNFDVPKKPRPPLLFKPPESLIKLPKEAKEYLENRKVVYEDSWLYSNSILEINGAELRLFNHIIIPFEYEDSWFGFQAVNINKKQYFIYLPQENYGLKLWNFYNTNLDEPVYFFESIFDAKSSGLKNIVSLMGISIDKNIKSLYKTPIFVFDNQKVDEASYNETEKLLNEGEKVMVWPTNASTFKDLNDIAKRGVPLEKIANFVEANIYSGMEGLVKLKLG